MKKLFFPSFITFQLLLFVSSNAQCGGVLLTSQAQIDNFPVSGCSIINGPLTILDNSGDITNLTGLSSLTLVSGNVTIQSCSHLTSLWGLHSLITVGGFFQIKNTRLQGLAGLLNLTTISSDFILDHNDSLVSLIGLSSMNTIGGGISINGDNPLLNLNELGFLTTLGGSLSIESYNGMSDLNGLQNLKTIYGSLAIAGVNSLNGLDSLTSINGVLQITNSQIPDLNKIANITGITYLLLQQNPNLSQCAVNSICNYLNVPTNPSSISSNSVGCNTRPEVLTECNLVTAIKTHIIINETSVYPNPTTGILNVDPPGVRETDLTLYNITGQIIYKATNHKTIDLSGLPNGVYYLQIKNVNGIDTKKIILNK